jgi:hypothetical protein
MTVKARVFALCTAVWVLQGAMVIAHAGIAFGIRESALNRLAERMGPITDRGEYDTGFLGITVSWAWIVPNITFTIAPQGITYEGPLHASALGLSLKGTVRGSVDVSISGGKLILRFSTGPVVLAVPLLGDIEITNIDDKLPYNMELPLEAVGFKTDLRGQGTTIWGHLGNLTLQYLHGEIRIDGDLTF